MATNGNDPRLEALESTLRGVAVAGLMPSAEPAGLREGGGEHNNVMALMAMLSERCRNMADTLASNADADRKEAYDFTNHLLDLYRRWAADAVVRKENELAELQRFLGKVGK